MQPQASQPAATRAKHIYCREDLSAEQSCEALSWPKVYLDDGHEGIEAIQMSALGRDRHANDRQRGHGSHHARQMRCTPSARNDDLHTSTQYLRSLLDIYRLFLLGADVLRPPHPQ